MFKAVTTVGFAVAVNANAYNYARGVPPVTQNCATYPTSQAVPWGLIPDREFGGCRCADQTEQEWGPNPQTYSDNTWACQCLNTDLYLNEEVKNAPADFATTPNGKKCGIIAECQTVAVTNQRT